MLDTLSRVSIVCFAASYAIVFALELTRLLFRSGVRGAIMLGFAGAGLLAHTIFLCFRAVSAAGPPLSSEHDWCLLAAWVMVAVYLYLGYSKPHTSIGLFLLPLALALIGAGKAMEQRAPFAREPASKVWGAIHGTAFVLATVSVLVGFAAGLMYFHQARRLKQKRSPGRGLRLPSLEWLQHTNSRALVTSMLLLAVGVLSGAILNVVRGGDSGHLPWYDPLVLSTLALLAWLVVASVFGGALRSSTAGRKVAYATIVSFVFLVVALTMMFFFTQHGGR